MSHVSPDVGHAETYQARLAIDPCDTPKTTDEWRPGKFPPLNIGLSVEQRFRQNIAWSPTGCWIWTGARNSDGYGYFRIGGANVRAHRWSYEQATKARLRDDQLLLHSCDVPACVNPAHLRIGTMKENVADMDSRGRRRSNGKKSAETRRKNKRLALIRAVAKAVTP